MREVHAEYIGETPSFVHVSMDITPADANKSSYSYGPWTLRKAEEPEPVSTSTHDKRAWKLPNRIWSFGGHSVKNNSNNGNNSNNSNNDTKIFSPMLVHRTMHDIKKSILIKKKAIQTSSDS
jgi:hypothetical protein